MKWLVRPVLGLAVAWGCAALWLDGPSSRLAAGLLATGFGLACAFCLARLPVWAGAAAVTGAVAVLAAWWLGIPPRNDRDWQPDVSRPPVALIEGSRVTIRDVRAFEWRRDDDFTERWETRSWDLDRLRGLDLFVSFWGPTLIAHTILAWDFEDGPPLAISIETRKERGESYSAVRGFFRQFELYYVVADERDVIRVRTGVRGEQVFLYRTRLPIPQARALLLDYLRELNELAERPKWYNALFQSCTISIRHHVINVGPRNPWSWKLLANGYLPELLYERGTIDTSLPLPELLSRSNVTEKAKAVDSEADFSRRIREGLPGFEAH